MKSLQVKRSPEQTIILLHKLNPSSNSPFYQIVDGRAKRHTTVTRGLGVGELEGKKTMAIRGQYMRVGSFSLAETHRGVRFITKVNEGTKKNFIIFVFPRVVPTNNRFIFVYYALLTFK